MAYPSDSILTAPAGCRGDDSTKDNYKYPDRSLPTWSKITERPQVYPSELEAESRQMVIQRYKVVARVFLPIRGSYAKRNNPSGDRVPRSQKQLAS